MTLRGAEGHRRPATTIPGPLSAVAAASRIQSIDLLRGADVLLMLFVNEVAGVRGAPAFLKHVGADVDGMTITDLVFPAFLFIVGIAVPFALGGRLRRGESRGRVLRHALARAAALLVMGVLMVNGERGVHGLLREPVWNLVMTAGVLLVWGVPEAGWGPLRRRWLRLAGVALLVLVALAYRTPELTGWFQVRPYWWGILGLIGWAYLAVAAVYLLVGERPAALTGLLAVTCALTLALETGGLGAAALVPVLRPMLGTHTALVLAGTLLGVLLRRHLQQRTPRASFLVEAAFLAAGLGAAGLLLHTLNGLHPAFRISKIGATAPWGLVSSALTAAAFLAVFLLADVAGWRRWPRSLAVAGENPLLAYVLAPALVSVFELTPAVFGGRNAYAALGQMTAVGLVRSAVFAWVVVRLSGWMRSRGVRVQL
ncbi:MAG TPA: DUF5009 domain-containing protein [Vicinamibacteria bacterium]|nr:DUF5009 domain-containing protein [Vicinamibacteria bacterium]